MGNWLLRVVNGWQNHSGLKSIKNIKNRGLKRKIEQRKFAPCTGPHEPFRLPRQRGIREQLGLPTETAEPQRVAGVNTIDSALVTEFIGAPHSIDVG